MRSIEFFQPESGRLPTAIAHNENRDLIRAGAASLSNAAESACRLRQMTLPFERLQEEGFLSLNNVAFTARLMLGNLAQESMTPGKGRILVGLALLGRRSHVGAINHRLGMTRPVFALAQMCQGRSGERIARLAAMTPIARQAVALLPRMQRL